MIALIWKELRENLKWALLAMAVLGAAETYALHYTSNGQPEWYSYSFGITLCKSAFLTVTSFACAAIGFLLGLLQVLPELNRDRWAALLHRPVSRSVIFLGKAVAGLVLYAIATVPPFLLCVWLAATPGHFAAPFVPELALAGTADTCAGLMYYFAGLVVALHRGGWIGLKALPLLAALHVSIFVVAAMTFMDAVGAAALMVAALSVAAWGAILGPELFAARPWLARFAFVAVVFYGLCGLGNVAHYIDAAMVPSMSYYSRYEVSDEGIPMKISYAGGVVVSVQDVDGKALPGENYKPDRVRNHLLYLNTCSAYIGDSHGWHPTRYRENYRSSETYIWLGPSYQRPRLEQWFYLSQRRYMVGVLLDSKQEIGMLDARGFQPTSAKPVPFPPDVLLNVGSRAYCLRDAKAVRVADVARKKITELSLPIPGAVYGMANAWANRKEGGSVQVAAVALATAMAIYDENDWSLIATLPYHRDVDRWGNVEVGMIGNRDRFLLWYYPSVWITKEARKGLPSYFEEVDKQGQVLHSYTLPQLPDGVGPDSWDEVLARRLQSPAFFFGTMVYQKLGAELGSERLKNALARQLGEDWGSTKATATWIIILSLLCAGITLGWARRVQFSWRRAWAWAGIAFALNLPGLLAFRLAADWPNLVGCSACQRTRPINGESCPHCGAGWPEPMPSGTEIFDRTNALEPAASA